MNLLNDKFLHFVFGVVISAFMLPFGYVWMFGITLLVAVLKELYDKQGYGTPDIRDIAATIAGSITLIAWYDFNLIF